MTHPCRGKNEAIQLSAQMSLAFVATSILGYPALKRAEERRDLRDVFFAMDTYYFDLHSGDSIRIDDNGVELPSKGHARRLALEFLGQKILDGTVENAAWLSKIEVRNRRRLVMRVSAAVMVDDIDE